MGTLARDTLEWLRRAWRPYGLAVLALALLPAAAGTRNAPLAAVDVAVLAVALHWLSRAVHTDRKERPGRGELPRTALAAVAAGAGAVLTLGGSRLLGKGQDGVFFLGVCILLLAVGALISEARLASVHDPSRARLLLALSVALAVGGLTVRGGSLWAVVLAALVSAGIGTELLTERVLQAPRSGGARSILAGVAVLLASALLLTAAGVTPSHVGLLMLGFGLAVWMVAVDGESMMFVLVLAAVLLWASSPETEALPDRFGPGPGDPYFVVLGDSYISGEGAERFIDGTNSATANEEATNECRRAQSAWPFVLADAGVAGVPSRVLFLACSGAVTENIHTLAREDGSGTHGPAELALYEQARERDSLGDPAFVVISVGGNDAGFGDVGATCVGPGDCTEVGQQFLGDRRRRAPDQPTDGPPGKGRAESLSFIDDDLDAAYARVAETFDGVPVVVVPYPVPLVESGRCDAVLLDQDERRLVNGFATELNDVVADAALRHGFWVLEDMEPALVNAGVPLCGESGARAGLNFLRLNPKGGSVRERLSPDSWLHNSLHPNEEGHRAMAAAAQRWFAEHEDLGAPEVDPQARHDVTDVDELMGRRVAQCVAEPECDVAGNRWTLGQAKALYARALVPSALAFVGFWLVLSPLLWIGRKRELSLSTPLRWLRRSTPPTPPPG